MAKEFVMGARLTLKDMFSSGLSSAARETLRFRKSVDDTNGALGRYRNTTGKIGEANGKFVSGTKQSKQSVDQLGNAATAAKGKISAMGLALGGIVTAAGVKTAWDWTVGANANMETYQNTLSVVLGSQEKAVETLAWANKFAAQTPFEIPQIIEATTRMSAYGLNAQKTLGIVGDMASVMGKDLMQAVEAVADAQTGELERLKEFGITKKMIEDQAKLLGSNPINSKGQITDAEAFNAALLSLMEKRFKGGMDIQAKSFKGMVSNVKDTIGTVGRELGKPLFDKAKANLDIFLKWLNKLQTDGSISRMINEVQYFGKVVGGVFTSSFRIARDNVVMIAGKIQKFYTDNKPAIEKIGAALVAAFTAVSETATPIIDWLRNTGLPGVIDALTTAGGWVLDIANYFVDNWSVIGPIVTGIAIAWGTYKVVLMAISAWTKIATKAQWLWNLALNANPIGLIVLAVGLLIGAGILLYKNWDTIKEKAGDMWIFIKNAFKTGVNQSIDFINGLIAAVNKIPGIEIQAIQKMQMTETRADRNIREEDERISTAQTRMMLDGSHFQGLPRVPFDGYVAELHKDEAVLPESEANAYRKGQINPAGSDASKRRAPRAVNQKPIQIEMHVHPSEGMDEEKLAQKTVDLLYDQMAQADEIASEGDLGGQL